MITDYHLPFSRHFTSAVRRNPQTVSCFQLEGGTLRKQPGQPTRKRELFLTFLFYLYLNYKVWWTSMLIMEMFAVVKNYYVLREKLLKKVGEIGTICTESS